jgi:hypothetical protein
MVRYLCHCFSLSELTYNISWQPQILIGRFMVNLRRASDNRFYATAENVSRFSALQLGLPSSVIGNIGSPLEQSDGEDGELAGVLSPVFETFSQSEFSSVYGH